MSLFKEAGNNYGNNTSSELQLHKFRRQRLSQIPSTSLQLGTIKESDAANQDRNRQLTLTKQSLVALCRNPVLERKILEEIDAQTRQETNEAIKKGELSTDCLIVGTGPAGVSLASKMRELYPNVNILMVDERDYRGGQFADDGYDYLLNTPRHGPKLGFAGEQSESNNLGNAAYLQVVDITDEDEYPRRKKLATCLKIDGFMAAPALVGVKVSSVAIEDTSETPYQVSALHKETGKNILIHPKVIAFARGRGKPRFGIDISNPDIQETLARRRDSIFVSEVYNNHLDTMSPREVLQEIKNRVAIIGAGDSANTTLDAVINKLLLIMSPQEIQKLNIDIYGTKYTSSSEFESTVGIHRYDGIIPYIGNFIRPHKEKAESLMVVGKNSVGISTQTSFGIYRTVALLTGFQNVPIENIVHKPNGVKLSNIYGEDELEGEIIAQQIEGENIFTVGVDVREPFPGKPPLFARSIVRLTPRILATAEKIVDILQPNTDV